MMHKTKNRAAFTLIELLAAMAVLAIMMLMFANIFSSSGKAWTSGTRRAEQNMNGRAVLEYMCKEIGQSIINTNSLVFQLGYNTATDPLSQIKSGLYYNSALHCVSTRGCVSYAQCDEAVLLNYYIGSQTESDGFTHYQLMRAQCTNRNTISTAYLTQTPAWLESTNLNGWTSSVLVDNVTQFYAVAGTNNTANTPGSVTLANFKSYDYANKRYQLPLYVDIIIGFLSEDDARKGNLFTGAAQTNFLNRAEKRFTRRIYMQNRTGCQSVP